MSFIKKYLYLILTYDALKLQVTAAIDVLVDSLKSTWFLLIATYF